MATFSSTVGPEPPALTIDALLRFLGELPTSPLLLDWTLELRRGLRRLLPDIDDISVGVNGMHRRSSEAIAELGMWVLSAEPLHRDGTLFVGDASAPRIEEWVRAARVDVERYHPPTITELWTPSSLLGILMLWRSRDASEISRATIDALGGIAPLLTRLLEHHLLLYRGTTSSADSFDMALRRIVDDAQLSRQELRVLTLRLYGQSYKEIASSLHISISTVKQHLAAVYRKSGVHSQTELLARYLAPHMRQSEGTAPQISQQP